MNAYIGPERRQGERRDPDSRNFGSHGRTLPDRRQEALAGVIVGLNADEMRLLASAWESLSRLEHVAGSAA